MRLLHVIGRNAVKVEPSTPAPALFTSRDRFEEVELVALTVAPEVIFMTPPPRTVVPTMVRACVTVRLPGPSRTELPSKTRTGTVQSTFNQSTALEPVPTARDPGPM